MCVCINYHNESFSAYQDDLTKPTVSPGSKLENLMLQNNFENQNKKLVIPSSPCLIFKYTSICKYRRVLPNAAYGAVLYTESTITDCISWGESWYLFKIPKQTFSHVCSTVFGAVRWGTVTFQTTSFPSSPQDTYSKLCLWLCFMFLLTFTSCSTVLYFLHPKRNTKHDLVYSN